MELVGIFGLLAVFGVLGLVVLALAVVFNNRGEVDSTGRRRSTWRWCPSSPCTPS